ncbi:hypothetical protein J6590_076564 [Homalodisca vitripennis]|nr:hypothetical protein J6590_076564 [Homalodisca vitripennis]
MLKHNKWCYNTNNLSPRATAGNKTITKEGAQNLAADIVPSSSTLSQYNIAVLRD